MTKKAQIKNHKRVSVCLSQEQLRMVEKMAIQISRVANPASLALSMSKPCS